MLIYKARYHHLIIGFLIVLVLPSRALSPHIMPVGKLTRIVLRFNIKRYFNKTTTARRWIYGKEHSHNSEASVRKILISLSGAALLSSLILAFRKCLSTESLTINTFCDPWNILWRTKENCFIESFIFTWGCCWLLTLFLRLFNLTLRGNSKLEVRVNLQLNNSRMF